MLNFSRCDRTKEFKYKQQLNLKNTLWKVTMKNT